MIVKVGCVGLRGMEGYRVDVEVKVMIDRSQMVIVGLPDATVQESKQRVMGALDSMACDMSIRKVVVNLSPAEWKKTGPMYDAAMVIGVLRAVDYFREDIPEDVAIIGAVSLSGELLPFDGLLPAVLAAQKLPFRKIYMPQMDLSLFPANENVELVPVSHMNELIHYLTGKNTPPKNSPKVIPLQEETHIHDQQLDFQNIIGQPLAKRALEISAAGGHHVFLSGPPGCGKSMLAEAFPTILPRVPQEAFLEVMSIYQLAQSELNLDYRPPFRQPHHSASSVSIIGGGTFPKPGEISLAHQGVLFLDELAEFPRKTLDMLRQPMETGKVTISRVRQTATYPAVFTLLAAANPCPCGDYGAQNRYCTCTPKQIRSYRQRISGPIYDRIDLSLELRAEVLAASSAEETSREIRRRVKAARKRQQARYVSDSKLNARAGYSELFKEKGLQNDLVERLQSFARDFHWSQRIQMKVLRLARTIADLAGEQEITAAAMEEACHWKSGQHHLILAEMEREKGIMKSVERGVFGS